MRRLDALAPAKVNLGLEVVRRRDDGYHELVTLMQAVSLYDQFVWTETGTSFEYVGPPGVAPEADLVWRALVIAEDLRNWTGRLQVVKRIPMAAGLGGGSSDAALALRLAVPDADDDELARLGARLGSDVPFFIRGGTALATGTGTALAPVETAQHWLVLVTPNLVIPEKTSALYSGLEPPDFSDGANVRDITTTLANGTNLPEYLPNAFTRQLLGYPVIRYAYDRLGQAGASLVSVSGAGPTVYAATAGQDDAAQIAERLARFTPDVGAINIVQTVGAKTAHPEIEAIAAALRGR
ncbi:MAG TPA: 4-(cytidine 5'-diphospho)-2-C-methyl-D-erythritol kinase [Thermomicrobiales bacterium]|nr:4-(cytidine 5'-diphospho)-2-C-methyl-D-erythritol kinase [Thermomicrobiales bacterium]